MENISQPNLVVQGFCFPTDEGRADSATFKTSLKGVRPNFKYGMVTHLGRASKEQRITAPSRVGKEQRMNVEAVLLLWPD